MTLRYEVQGSQLLPRVIWDPGKEGGANRKTSHKRGETSPSSPRFPGRGVSKRSLGESDSPCLPWLKGNEFMMPRWKLTANAPESRPRAPKRKKKVVFQPSIFNFQGWTVSFREGKPFFKVQLGELSQVGDRFSEFQGVKLWVIYQPTSTNQPPILNTLSIPLTFWKGGERSFHQVKLLFQRFFLPPCRWSNLIGFRPSIFLHVHETVSGCHSSAPVSQQVCPLVLLRWYTFPCFLIEKRSGPMLIFVFLLLLAVGCFCLFFFPLKTRRGARHILNLHRLGPPCCGGGVEIGGVRTVPFGNSPSATGTHQKTGRPLFRAH